MPSAKTPHPDKPPLPDEEYRNCTAEVHHTQMKERSRCNPEDHRYLEISPPCREMFPIPKDRRNSRTDLRKRKSRRAYRADPVVRSAVQPASSEQRTLPKQTPPPA